ncbi:MAG: type I restriction enzyme HsdR N-terminal domain-containing protein [Gammaproteobacteria bacterium]|nr:type I restriction enzyme HsdR N-terminal domain-containing protein [Gammaproteobacteria bacterium]
MTDNFLPEYEPVRTPTRTHKTLRCEVENKERRQTPEELVRQRVLHWLIHDKGWDRENLRLEKNYRWVGDAHRHRGRPDIELLCGDKVLVVVECKRPEVPLSERVDNQAIDYAEKSRAPWIWTTNGEDHGFMRKDKNVWKPVSKLEPLDVLSDPPVADLQFPGNPEDQKDLKKYWEAFRDPQFYGSVDYDREFLLATHRVLFGVKKKLPYSHGGVHILEDRGSAWHQFSTPGGSYFTRYADFMAATQGTVEAVSIAVNRWGRGGLRLCVGVTKPNRAHHSLQLDTAKCEWNPSSESWSIYCDGAMSQVKSADVMEAVREARAGTWIEKDGGRERICLGKLRNAKTAVWKNSRELLANLIHYGIIRSNLRDSISSR